MQRSPNYPYHSSFVSSSASSASSSSRRSSNHGTSSAFSANANPNEDWTKISDLAERRRIQNRIAQRNYRKKLKRRLEDLEKRAASTSASPEMSPEDPELSKPSVKSRGRNRTKQYINNSSRNGNNSSNNSNYHGLPIPSISHDSSYLDERAAPGAAPGAVPGAGNMFSHQCTRQLSASPPPVFSYASYSQLNPYGPAYGQSPPLYHSPSFQGTTATPSFHDLSSFPGDYSTAPVKRIYADEEILSPFSMSYATMAGIDLGPNMQPLTESSLPVNLPSRWP